MFKRWFVGLVALVACWGASAEEVSSNPELAVAAQAEVEALMNSRIGVAEKMLIEYGEFYPYGAAIDAEGETQFLASLDETEDPSALLELLRKSVRLGADSGEFDATALFYDVLIELSETEGESDAIAVELDHRQGLSLVVVVPYSIEDGRVTFGDFLAQEGEAAVFNAQ